MYSSEKSNASEIYVGNLHSETLDSDLKYFFEKYGEVKHAKVMVERQSGMPRGFGFVTFFDVGGSFQRIHSSTSFFWINISILVMN